MIITVPFRDDRVLSSSSSLCRVRVQRLEDVLEVCPTILTEDGMQAQHLGATLALYTLVKGQVRIRRDPPSPPRSFSVRKSGVSRPWDVFCGVLLALVVASSSLFRADLSVLNHLQGPSIREILNRHPQYDVAIHALHLHLHFGHFIQSDLQ